MEIKENEIEIWKDVIGYENLYQISSLGRIKSFGNGGSYNSKERILKQAKTPKGYLQIALCKDGKKKTFRVHKLVAMTFIPNPNNYPQINHKNESKIDNRIENLEWCTQKYNNNYGTHNQRMANTKKGKPNLAVSKPILQFNREGTKIIGKYNSAKQVERELNLFATSIVQCCKGKRKTAGKYKWKYLSDYINEQIPYLNELKAYRNRLYDILKKVS